MNAPTVEQFLPQAAPASPPKRAERNSGSSDKEQSSFDRCLRSSSEQSQKADSKKSDKPEKTEEKSEAKPEKKEKTEETKDSKESDKKKDKDTEAVDNAAAEAVVDLVKEQKTDDTQVNIAGDSKEKTAAPVEVVQTKETTNQQKDDEPTAPAAEASKADAGKQVTVEQAAATDTKASADTGQTQQTEKVQKPEQTIAEKVQEKVEKDTEKLNAHTESSDAAKREPVEPITPTAPAPHATAADQPTNVNLNPGQQMHVEVRETTAVGQPQQIQVEGTSTRVSESQVVNQVVRGAARLSPDGRSEVRVQLRPPELGTVRIELSSDRSNVVEARVVVERDDVRQLVERNLPQLRESLAASGVEVGSFDVSTQDSGQQFDNSADSENQGFAWDGAEPEDEQADGTSSGSARRINRAAAGEVDYVI